MKILAIESSCDETSAAVIDDGKVLSNIISSQFFHSKYGGVVPELASRSHLQTISAITNEALETAEHEINDIDSLAVTSEPGLIGSLIVGANYAKGLSLKYGIPVIPVNHIEGHLFSGTMEDESLKFPFVCLVVSGGHTALFNVKSYNKYDIIGLTKDDAAGEAFDKIAKLLGLPYPGGPVIDKISKQGNPEAYDFPRPMITSPDLNFSFSGLKTSVRYFLAKKYPDGIPEKVKPDIAASVQAAICDVLVSKSFRAAKKYNSDSIVVAGGVSANSELRAKMQEKAEKLRKKVVVPAMEYCIDNAAMICFLAEKKLEERSKDDFFDLEFTVNPTALRARG